jgi:hypothetical protein
MIKFEEYYRLEEGINMDTVQTALDIAGIEPTIGTAADIANTVISGLRAALAKTSDERKKHILNAGISAVSILPFGDIFKILKLRKLARPVAKMAVGGARSLKTFGKAQQMKGDRFFRSSEQSSTLR